MSKTTLSNALCLSGAGWFSSSGFNTACVHSRLHERWLAKDSWCRHTYIYRKCPASALSIPLSTTALSFSAGKTSNRYSGLFFFQVRHVDEGHSACAKTEDKHVSGKIQVGIPWQIQFFYLSYLVNHDTSFHSLIHAAINMPERRLKKFDSQTCHQM